MSEEIPPHPIILFDGVCNLCNGFVQFVVKRDTNNVFKFGSLQSENVQQILKQFGSKGFDLTTVVLLDGKKIFIESDAVLNVARKLGGVWILLHLVIVLPKFIRDAVYRFISKRRYQMFGRRGSCMMPTQELLNRFI